MFLSKMSGFCTSVCRCFDRIVVCETYRLSVIRDDGMIIVRAEYIHHRDCFSYRREKDGHLVFGTFKTGNVMRLLVITYDTFDFRVGSFQVCCNRENVLLLSGGSQYQNLVVHADFTVTIESGQTLTAHTLVLSAQHFNLNGTLKTETAVLQNHTAVTGNTEIPYRFRKKQLTLYG